MVAADDWCWQADVPDGVAVRAKFHNIALPAQMPSYVSAFKSAACWSARGDGCAPPPMRDDGVQPEDLTEVGAVQARRVCGGGKYARGVPRARSTSCRHTTRV